MIGIIATHETMADLKQVLMDKNVIFERAGFFEGDAFFNQCHAATVVHLQTLIVEASVTDDTSLVRGIRHYRFSKNSRIILLAAGREPGDAAISTLVGFGVWDIIAPNIPVSLEDDEEEERVDYGQLVLKHLAKPSGYADAARWHTYVEETHTPNPVPEEKPKKTTQKQIPDIEDVIDFEALKHLSSQKVLQEKIVGTIVIAVGGAYRRTGTTHTAIQISKFLSDLGHKVACIELLDPRSGSQYSLKYLDTSVSSKVHPGGFELQRIDFFPQTSTEEYFQIVTAGYQYIVLDLGVIVHNSAEALEPYEHTREFLRANTQVLTAGAAEWDFIHVLTAIDAFHLWKWRKQWNILVNFADDESFSRINNYLDKKDKNLLQINFLKNGFASNPFTISDETDRLYRSLLHDFLPVHQRTKKKRGFFRKR